MINSKDLKIYSDEFAQFLKRKNIEFDNFLRRGIEELVEIFQNHNKNKQNDLISRYLKSSSVKFSKKINLIKEICNEENFLNFLSVVNKLGDFNNIDKILEYILKHFNFSKKEIEAVVFSVFELEEIQISEIKKLIFEKTGLNATVQNKIKRDILGGFIIKLENLILDMSIKKILNKIEMKIAG